MHSRKTVEVRENISPSHAVITAANWRHEGVWVLPVSCLHKYAPAELRKGSRRGARSLAPSHAAPTVCVQRAPLFLLHGDGAADARRRWRGERTSDRERVPAPLALQTVSCEQLNRAHAAPAGSTTLALARNFSCLVENKRSGTNTKLNSRDLFPTQLGFICEIICCYR